MTTFTKAFAIHGPDVEKLAQAIRIREPDADKLKNYMMDNKPLGSKERKNLNLRATRMAKRHALRVIREMHRVAA